MSGTNAVDPHVLEIVVAIGAAYVLALPIGWERKTSARSGIGFRTLPLVSVGACTYLLLSRYLYDRGIYDADGLARVLRAMMTGIGFIGGGAIVKESGSVSGVATGAAVWTTGAIGAAVAHGYYVVAIVLALTNFVILDATRRLGRRAQAALDRNGDDDHDNVRH